MVKFFIQHEFETHGMVYRASVIDWMRSIANDAGRGVEY